MTTAVLALYDYDAAGQRAARNVKDGLQGFTDAPVEFQLLAITEEQIEDWNLPTRPAKASDPEAHKFGSDAVELDAILPDRLIDLVENAITDLVDKDAWRVVQRLVEEDEREKLRSLAADWDE